MSRNNRRALIPALALGLAVLTAFVPGLPAGAAAQEKAKAGSDPATRLWYSHPADKWEKALPVGNGRLGAMVFGKTDEEEIQLNEDTYWSGGPYSTVLLCSSEFDASARAGWLRWCAWMRRHSGG